MNARIVILTCLLVVSSVFSSKVSAQNNPYEIDDQVYDYFTMSRKAKGTDRCIPYVRAGQQVALDKGDYKGLCVITSSELAHYFALGDDANFNRVADELRKISRQYGYSQYYYHSFNSEVSFLLNKGRVVSALDLANEVMHEAERENDAYGVFGSYRAIANIYHLRGNKRLAVENYKKAIDWYWNTDLKETQSISQTYFDVSTLMPAKDDSTLFYVEKVIETAKTYADTLRYATAAALIYSAREEYDDFYRYFDYLEKENVLNPIDENYLSILLTDAFQRKDFEEAERLIHENASSTNREVYGEWIEYAKAKGDWKMAFENLEKQQDHKDSLATEASASDIAEYSVKFRTEHIENQARHKRQSLVIIVMVLVTALFIIVSFLITYLLLIKHKQFLELEAMNKVIDEARVKAESGSKMKDLFVQNMSHEIRTPLNAILGFSQLLSSPGLDWDDAEKEQFSKAIMNNGEMLTMLIDDILNIADIESGNYSINITNVSVDKILDSSISSVEYRVPDGVALINNAKLPEGFTLNTDPGRVQQILINYLTNACKHTVKGSITVDASLEENPGMITFSVTDTGEGIPKEKAEHIFERFTKLNSFVQGTGLGLNICKMVSQKLKGTVKVDTSYTEGARFVFIHPLDLELTDYMKA
ncbi:MAG: HAMP domain-containing histidine kinase [Bacteroidales bacterium]|nr:HAMP domain-containing histidine kinase [Candidatus Cryptobacteroides caccocaballi]